MNTHDKRLIEDYLPIEAISEEASREKSVRKGHISTLHLWWARRPLVACRAAVYGALVPASQFVPNGGTDAQKKSLGRANAAKFVKSLCQYPGSPSTIKEAQEHILKAHAERLTKELADAKTTGTRPVWAQEFKFTGECVTVEDIQAGRAPRPRVLDMFAGGGAIPLEALRLGCEAYALDLNPVAHIIQLCTLVYPQKFGKPDPNVRGMTGPKNAKGETTWGGLAEEVRYWGNWVLEKVKAEIGDLYPLIPDPEFRPRIDAKGRECFREPQKTMVYAADAPQTLGSNLKSETPNPQSRPGYLTPVAYLWTRTVKCKNPTCGATVPLVKQTWLCKKEGRYVALRMVADARSQPRMNANERESAADIRVNSRTLAVKQVRFEVVEAPTEKGLGFDPAGFSKGGNATCPFCGTVADNEYVKAEGCAGRIGQQLMAIVCTRPGKQGKVYLAADSLPEDVPNDAFIRQRIQTLCQQTGLTVPSEPITTDAKNSCWTHLYGLGTFGDLFTPRQMLCLLTFAAAVREFIGRAASLSLDQERAKAVATLLACALDKVIDCNNSLCAWEPVAQCARHLFGRQAIPMVWDFGESVAFAGSAGDWNEHLGRVLDSIGLTTGSGIPATVCRGSATALPWPDAMFDAVITDPPYYDNVPYADISDFFYVWLKRTIGHLYPEHFATVATPKKSEAVADATRHGGSKEKARRAYEEMMAKAFREAHRVLKPDGQMTVVYAHKTTLGWSTLVDALRQAGFTVTESWPLDTEMKARLRGMDSAALASSIFLVARKRDGAEPANYEEAVKPELEQIVRERVETLWDQGISGADLVIACVGAGLRAFTRFASVEYANGEEVPAERFLTEVETAVLETILERLSKQVAANGRESTRMNGEKSGSSKIGVHSRSLAVSSLSGLDAATRFYILWRYTYGTAELDAGEAIIFSNGTHVELDGPHGLATGADALVEKKKGKYRLRDFSERGENEDLGMPSNDGQAAPLVDALHRTLWLMEKRPTQLAEFLQKSQVNREQLRLVAQALAGPALKGGELGDVSPTAELAALGKLLANWQSVVEDAALTAAEKEERKTGQQPLKL